MKVSGEFPLIDLPELRILFRAKEGQLGAVFARFEIEVTSLSHAKLLLNLTDGLTAWLDATPIKLEKETLLDFPVGRHRVTFALEFSQRQDSLRADLAHVSGSAAIMQSVSEKWLSR